MVAEAWWSPEFEAAFDDLDEGKQIEVDFAIYEIEENPSWWGNEDRALATSEPFGGYLADFSVDGYAIVYKTADQGAVVELWYLYPVPDDPELPYRNPPEDDEGRYPPMM